MNILVLSRGAEALETSSLVEGLRGGGKLDVAMRAPPPAPGYQVNWVEIITIYLVSKPTDAVMGRTYNALLNHVIEQARQWYQRTRTERGGKRPLQVTIRNRIGRLLKAVSFTKEGEQDITGESRGRLAPPPSAEELERRVDDPRAIEQQLSRSKSRGTVIFADVSNFTGLLSRQSKSVHRWMKESRDQWEGIITERGGTVILSKGDTVAGWFQDEEERPRSTDDAVFAALAIAATPRQSGHRRFSKVSVRVGVATGMTSEFHLLARRGNGAVLTTAAALSVICPNGVYIDTETRRSLKEDAFRLEHLGTRLTPTDRRRRRVWRVTICEVEQG